MLRQMCNRHQACRATNFSNVGLLNCNKLLLNCTGYTHVCTGYTKILVTIVGFTSTYIAGVLIAFFCFITGPKESNIDRIMMKRLADFLRTSEIFTLSTISGVRFLSNSPKL